MPNDVTDATASGGDEKRQIRQSRLVKAALECDRLGHFDVTIRNVSQTGVGGRAPHALTLGERVNVHLPGHLPMGGTVRWVVDTRFGIETDREIEFERLRAAHGNALLSADSAVEFRISPPVTTNHRRPPLVLGRKGGDRHTSNW